MKVEIEKAKIEIIRIFLEEENNLDELDTKLNGVLNKMIREIRTIDFKR